MLSPLLNFWLYQIFARYTWNLSFLWLHPLAVYAGSVLLDWMDFYFYLLTGENRDFYDRTDKAADALFYLAGAIYYTYFWHQLWYARYIAPFFFYRLLGNIIMIVTLANWVPIVFPNVGGLLMLFFSVLDYFPLHAASHRRWDRWWKVRIGWTVFAVLLLVVLKVVMEWVMWGDGNSVVPEPRCASIYICWTILGVPLLMFVFFATLASYWRHPNFEPDTVRYTAAGVPLKVTKRTEMTTVADVLL